MSSKLTFLTDNKAVGATYSMLTGTENAQFPLTNVDKVFTTKVFRSNEASAVIQVAFDSSQSIDTFAIVGNNLTGLGVDSVTVEGSPTTSFPGTNIETVNLSSDHNFGFKFLDNPGSFRYWKITLTGTSYCELSNIYLGARTVVANNNIDTGSFTYSLRENFKAKSNNYRQLFIDKYNSSNELSGDIKFANSVEFEQLNNVYAEVGNTTPIWFILDSEGNLSTDGSSKYLFSGYFYLSGKLQWKNAAPSLWDTKISLIEVV